ncbi:MAG: hypothetical protein JSV04_06200 [Candidatus Heimdallarchaeota archaeon]|nr:MAG: hypothetical protein JSV04_06200 [Candidatus Heimdallarchaeota archaeon]
MNNLLMIEIHFYGSLKKKIDPNASMAEDTVLFLPYKKDESFLSLLNRLDILPEECGDCFLNGIVITNKATVIPKGARVGLFPVGMYLLCGGQHLKGHGYITVNNPNQKSDYY